MCCDNAFLSANCLKSGSNFQEQAYPRRPHRQYCHSHICMKLHQGSVYTPKFGRFEIYLNNTTQTSTFLRALICLTNYRELITCVTRI